MTPQLIARALRSLEGESSAPAETDNDAFLHIVRMGYAIRPGDRWVITQRGREFMDAADFDSVRAKRVRGNA